MIQKIWKKLTRKVQKILFAEQWSLLVCSPEGKFLKHIAPPPDRIWADPFPVAHEGRYYIFIEQQFQRKNGTLGYIELFTDLSYSPFTPILEAPYHLSYPNVFNVQGTWYMIPEAHEHASIDLYRAASFPDTWVFDSTLIAGIEAVDTSILFYENNWWLFTSTAQENRGLNSSLSLYYSTTFPSTEWKAHCANPVVIGSGNSRMAGTVYYERESGSLLRIAQSCTKEYGEHLVRNRILVLNTTEYKEECIEKIYPEKDLHAVCTHTWNACPPYVIRDIKTRKFRYYSSQLKKIPPSQN